MYALASVNLERLLGFRVSNTDLVAVKHVFDSVEGYNISFVRFDNREVESFSFTSYSKSLSGGQNTDKNNSFISYTLRLHNRLRHGMGV